VGAIGMCVTGGFALAMAVEPAVLALVVSQPGLPAPLTAAKRAAVGLDASDLAQVKERTHHGLCMLGLRFPPIGAAQPSGSPRSAASLAKPLRPSRSTPRPATRTPSPPGRMRY
jgi:hypothetical protein